MTECGRCGASGPGVELTETLAAPRCKGCIEEKRDRGDEVRELGQSGIDSYQDEDTEPRERCPKCGVLVVVESEDPLEEHCPSCDYYRAETANGSIIRE